MADGTALVRRLRAALGAASVRDDTAARLVYARDASHLRLGAPLCVCLPADAAQVAAAVRLCAEHDTPFVARGAGSGLAGGALPPEGAVVISLARLVDIAPSPSGREDEILAGAGVPNAVLDRHLARSDRAFAPDPGSQEVSTLGGKRGLQRRRPALPEGGHHRASRARTAVGGRGGGGLVRRTPRRRRPRPDRPAGRRRGHPGRGHRRGAAHRASRTRGRRPAGLLRRAGRGRRRGGRPARRRPAARRPGACGRGDAAHRGAGLRLRLPDRRGRGPDRGVHRSRRRRGCRRRAGRGPPLARRRRGAPRPRRGRAPGHVALPQAGLRRGGPSLAQLRVHGRGRPHRSPARDDPPCPRRGPRARRARGQPHARRRRQHAPRRALRRPCPRRASTRPCLRRRHHRRRPRSERHDQR